MTISLTDPFPLLRVRSFLNGVLAVFVLGSHIGVVGYAGVPLAATQPATGITASSAKLNGMATPNGVPAQAWFEWGMSSSFGSSTSGMDVGQGEAVVCISAGIQGLGLGNVYHYRLVVSNATGQLAFGPEVMFCTGRRLTVSGLDRAGSQSPTPPLGLTNVVAADGGRAHDLALLNDGTIRVWGNNDYGQTNSPAGLSNVIAVAAGAWHCLALKDDGTVVAWGYNAAGQTRVPAGLTNVIAIGAGGWHSLALKSNGKVVQWGGLGGQMLPATLTNVVSISTSGDFALALRNDGTVVAGGLNLSGPITPPAGLSNVVAVGAAVTHCLAVKQDGTVVAWGGDNNYGQTNVPPGLSNVVSVTGGWYHSLALKADGGVVGWGDDQYGEIGILSGLGDAGAIGSGDYYSLALTLNVAPVAVSQTFQGFPNHELLIPLLAVDPNGDAVHRTITHLPSNGGLYQYDPLADTRGVAILAGDTDVSDARGRVVYVPAVGELGNPYSSFGFKANDAELQSSEAQATVNIVLPPAPLLVASSWSNAQFRCTFSGHSNATYRMWASTNLLDWQVLGPASMTLPGIFEWVDPTGTGWPQRFYRAGAP